MHRSRWRFEEPGLRRTRRRGLPPASASAIAAAGHSPPASSAAPRPPRPEPRCRHHSRSQCHRMGRRAFRPVVRESTRPGMSGSCRNAASCHRRTSVCFLGQRRCPLRLLGDHLAGPGQAETFSDPPGGGTVLMQDTGVSVLAEALEAEVDAYIAAFAAERDENGHRLVVRNGYHQPPGGADQRGRGGGDRAAGQRQAHRPGHRRAAAVLLGDLAAVGAQDPEDHRGAAAAVPARPVAAGTSCPPWASSWARRPGCRRR